MAIQLTQTQIDTLNNLRSQGNYPGAYSYLANIVSNTPGADPRLVTWLEDASHINANDGSFISDYVRNATAIAAAKEGQTLTPEQFQNASDQLAEGIIDGILGGGQVKDLDDMMREDVKSVVENLGLNPDGWAGTAGAWLPTWMGGLDLDVNSPFYQDLYKSFHERGIDNFFEITSKWLDIFETSAEALLNATEAQLQNLWQGLNNFFDEFYGDIRNIDVKCSDLYTSAQRFLPLHDPLIIDLDRDGIETTSVSATNPVMFDLDGDGIKTATGWVSSDDGFLVLDRNGNGVIDNGKELFGDATPLIAGGTAHDGFDALRDLDSNGDGQFDANDAQFNNVRLWQDLNQDGISQANELSTLASLGIASLDTGSTVHALTLDNGNQLADLGTYRRVDGTTGDLGQIARLADVNLAQDTFHRTFTDTTPITTEAQALPTMQGSGALRDLREAASLGNAEASTLTARLTQYANATTRDAQLAQLEQLLDAWADTSQMSETLDDRDSSFYVRYDAFGNIQRSQNYLPNFDGSPGNDGAVGAAYWNRDLDLNLTPEYKNLISGWSQKIHILEAFNGRYFFNLPDHTQPGVSAVSGMTLVMSSGDGGGGGIGGESPFLHIRYSQAQLDLLNQSYDALKQSVYDALFLQTRGKPYLDAITLNVDEAGNIVLDYSAMETLLRDHMTQDARTGFQDLADLVNSTGRDLASAGWQIPTFMSDITSVLETTDVGRGFLDNPKSWGLCEDFLLLGDTVANSITGTTQADALLGGAGNNQLNGASASEAWPLAA